MKEFREKCYRCYRPKTSCMCTYIQSIDTDTKFVILMHPKEFKKVKNGTGHITHLSLKNSELFVGVDFTKHSRVNEIIKTHQSFVLYPSKNAINISKRTLEKPVDIKKRAVFIIDATWSCSSKILRDSKNINKLPYISFSTTKISKFKIKQQPHKHCLSTIESVLTVLELFKEHGIENISKKKLTDFLKPFYEMIKYQQKIIENPLSNAVRFKRHKKNILSKND